MSVAGRAHARSGSVHYLMRRERPLIVDLSLRAAADLAKALRDRREAVNDADARSVVLDLGPRRVLPADAVGELILSHRALRAAGGRCAVVVGPALAARLSLAYPEGILWAATYGDRRAACGPHAPPRASPHPR